MNFPPYRDTALVVPNAKALRSLYRALEEAEQALAIGDGPFAVRLEVSGCYAVSYSELKEANVTDA